MSKQTDAVNEDPELVISVSANDAYTEEERNQLAKGFGDTFGTIAQSYSYFEASADSSSNSDLLSRPIGLWWRVGRLPQRAWVGSVGGVQTPSSTISFQNQGEEVIQGFVSPSNTKELRPRSLPRLVIPK